jgi:hypothetical protein
MIIAVLILAFIRTLTHASDPIDTNKPSSAAGSCKEYRTIFNIVWPCFLTMFLCAWTAVHPNIPGPDEGKLSILWTRLKLVGITLLAPEVTLFLALEQRSMAKNLAKYANDHGE